MAEFNAGMISNYGLILQLGATVDNVNEKQTGLMYVTSLNNLRARTPTTGPTGAWLNEWWSAANYLGANHTYGLYVGGTGASAGYADGANVSTTNTALHSTTVPINVVFEGGNTWSAGAALNIANTRKDCFAILGAIKGLTLPVDNPYSGHTADFGFGATSENAIFIAGRKRFLNDWKGTGRSSSEIKTQGLSPDIAGSFARQTENSGFEWLSAAGTLNNRGRVFNLIGLEQTFTDTDVTNLKTNRVNPVITYSGRGSYFMGNETGKASGSQSNIDIQGILNYLRKQLRAITPDYSFTPNSSTNRASFVTAVTAIMDNMISSSSISAYSIICDDSNNTTQTISEGKFIAEINFTPNNAIETITITITNDGTSESITVS